MTSTEKANFRHRKEWKEFRESFKKEKDAITGKKLSKRFNLHHLDMSDANYMNLSNRDNFIPLNSKSHEALHWAWEYYKKDPAFLDRFKEALDKMALLNSDSSDMKLFKK